MIVELIDDFFAEYPATSGDKVDTSEADVVVRLTGRGALALKASRQHYIA